MNIYNILYMNAIEKKGSCQSSSSFFISFSDCPQFRGKDSWVLERPKNKKTGGGGKRKKVRDEVITICDNPRT